MFLLGQGNDCCRSLFGGQWETLLDGIQDHTISISRDESVIDHVYL